MKNLLTIIFIFVSFAGFSQYKIANDLLLMDGSDSILLNPDYDT
ncbi:unnamed protein product, partial [marine sediment metagenome]